MQTKDNFGLPTEAVTEFEKLLLNKGITNMPNKEITKLANEFLQFMKIILKGHIKYGQKIKK